MRACTADIIFSVRSRIAKVVPTGEFADISGVQLSRILGADYASGGSASGTLTLSATQEPITFMLQAQSVTDGITGTFRLLKCKSNQLTMRFNRESYTVPNLAGMAYGNEQGTVCTYTI